MPEGTAGFSTREMPSLFRPSPGEPRGDAALVNALAEQALLGALLTKPDLLQAVPPTFDPSHYGVESSEEIHRAIVAVGQPGAPAAIAVMQAIALDDKDLKAYIAHLLTAAVGYTPGLIKQYCNAVTDLYRRRKLVELGAAMQDSARASGEGMADRAIAQTMNGLDVLTTTGGDTRPAVSLREAVEAALAKAEAAAKQQGPSGLSTGFRDVDEALGGLDDGTMHVVAARPAMGKTSLGLAWAVNAARQGVGVCFISLEMSAAELGRRALAMMSGVPVWAMKRGMHARHGERLAEAARELAKLPLTIEDTSGLTAAQIGLKVRAAHRRHGVGLVAVDHLHIVRPDDADMRAGPTWAVGRVSGAMKRLAKEHACPVLLLAQLNRGVEARDDKRPGLADLRQSGDIEQDADTVSFLYRHEYYLGKEPEKTPQDSAEKHANRVTQWLRAKAEAAGKAELILAKVRDGAPGTINLTFNGETISFGDADHGV